MCGVNQGNKPQFSEETDGVKDEQKEGRKTSPIRSERGECIGGGGSTYDLCRIWTEAGRFSS